MAKKTKKHLAPDVRNMVHYCMVLETKSVAHKSRMDYDRKRLKQQLKRGDYE